MANSVRPASVDISAGLSQCDGYTRVGIASNCSTGLHAGFAERALAKSLMTPMEQSILRSPARPSPFWRVPRAFSDARAPSSTFLLTACALRGMV